VWLFDTSTMVALGCMASLAAGRLIGVSLRNCCAPRGLANLAKGAIGWPAQLLRTVKAAGSGQACCPMACATIAHWHWRVGSGVLLADLRNDWALPLGDGSGVPAGGLRTSIGASHQACCC